MKWVVSSVMVLLLFGWFGPRAALAQNAQPDCGPAYRVQRGDTFSAIAQKCGVRLSALLAANPQIDDPNYVFPGQTLNIPQGDQPGSQPGGDTVTGGSVYLTQPGDTLAKIAGRFQVSVDQLVEANLTLQPDSSLLAGRVLTLPQGAAAVPTISVSPSFGRAGDSVTLAATGFLADLPVLVGLGEASQAVYQVLEARTDANGALFRSFKIPDWVEPGRSYAFAIQPARQPGVRAISNTFAVQSGEASIPVTGLFVYQVNEGDTLQGLAERYRTSEATLLAINPAIGAARIIYPGQLIRVMGATLPQTGSAAVFISLQTAQPGDQIQVVGVHFPAGAKVDVSLVQQGQPHFITVDARVSREGIVLASVPLPLLARNGEQWLATITTTELSPSTQARSLPFQIVSATQTGPWVGVSAATARPGEVLQVRVQNFPPNARVDIRIGKVGETYTNVVDGQTDRAGELISSISIPDTASPGQNWVVTVLTTDRRNGRQAASQPILITP